jgi:hypothetical protein
MSYSGWGELTVPGEITGYRSWKPLMSQQIEPALCAYTQGYIWKPGLNVAECLRGGTLYGYRPHRPMPSKDCTCGFYARSVDDDHGYNIGISGVIKASGRVILGATGFRAEFARIVALYSDTGYNTYLENHAVNSWTMTWRETQLRCAARYGVPLFNNFQEAVEAFPPDDLSAFRKEPKPKTVECQPVSSSATTVQLPGWPNGLII